MIERVLARFDEEMRRDPPCPPGEILERRDGIVRCLGSYNTIISWPLAAEEVERRVSEQADDFTERGEAVEWKVYGHDGPSNLTAALAAHGFEPEEPETLMAFELTTDGAELAAPAGVEVRPVRTLEELDVYVEVTTRAFGAGPKTPRESLAPRLFDADGDLLAFVAWVDAVPAAAARLELPRDRAFASMWGGGTDPAFRRRGIFRALVAERAAVARSRGYSFLTVDAKETSRPILVRLGFVALTSVTAWVFAPRTP